jgi:hypothetical protein
MERNRFSPETRLAQLPRAPRSEVRPAGFVLLPLGLVLGPAAEQWLWQQWVYLRAFEQAQAVVRPSLLERDLLGVWN